MNFSFAEGLSPESRIWIYQSSREFNNTEIAELDEAISTFTRQWTAHNHQLTATGKILFNRFIMLVVDETHTGASGCSIDKSVHFIQEVERHYKVNLFDRLTLAFKTGEEIITFPMAELKEKFAEGVINEKSLFLNNTITKLSDLDSNWIITAGNSWLTNRLKKEKV